MTEWFDKGCKACRDGVLSGASNPAKVATNVRAHVHLLSCSTCGSWWLETEREAHVIDDAEARSTFPAFFG